VLKHTEILIECPEHHRLYCRMCERCEDCIKESKGRRTADGKSPFYAYIPDNEGGGEGEEGN